MNYLIISDLHIGSPLFTKKKEVMELVNSEIYDKIIVNGDIIDTWETWVSISSKHPIVKLLNTISNMTPIRKVIIVRGNHDPKFDELKSIFRCCEVVESYTFKLDNDDECIVMHGHQFNDIIRTYDNVAKMMFPIQWIFERLNINISLGLRELYHSIAAKIQHKYYNDLILDIEKTAVNKYKDKYKYIFLGHTHFPKLVTSKETTYVNSGDFIHNNTYVEIIGGVISINTLEENNVV